MPERGKPSTTVLDVAEEVLDDRRRRDVADVLGGLAVDRLERHADDLAVGDQRAAARAAVDGGVDLHQQQLLARVHVAPHTDA
jgi:hypothetical protein